MRGGSRVTSTLYLRFMRSTVISTCMLPTPEISSCFVSGSNWWWTVGSSSSMRDSALEILSSSPRVLGWIAKLMAGSGNVRRGSSKACASSLRVSPVRVSLSFWATPISPGPRSLTGFCVLPCSHATWPMRSRAPRLGFDSVESAFTVPVITRKSESLPMCGSCSVLNTSALGAVGRHLRFRRLAIGVEERLHLGEVDVALEPRLLADGEVQRHDAALETARERVQRAEEVGALAVEPVDDDGARQLVLVRELPDLLRLHLHAGDGVHDHDRGIDHAQAGARVGDEITVPRRVDEIDAVAFPVTVRHRGVDRYFALDLVGVEVGGRAAVVHLAEPRDGAGGEQQGFHEGGFADAAVADDTDVADLPDLDRHKTGLLGAGGAR